ncbi:MAG: hypothetical protein ACO376_07010 [Gammaproteobacteria bacterium]
MTDGVHGAVNPALCGQGWPHWSDTGMYLSALDLQCYAIRDGDSATR